MPTSIARPILILAVVALFLAVLGLSLVLVPSYAGAQEPTDRITITPPPRPTLTPSPMPPEPTSEPAPPVVPEASTLLLFASAAVALAGYAGLQLNARRRK